MPMLRQNRTGKDELVRSLWRDNLVNKPT